MKSLNIAPFMLSLLIFVTMAGVVRAGDIEYLITINDRVWTKTDSIIATLKVTNLSKVNETVSLGPSFHLVTEGISTSDVLKSERNTYWAAVNAEEPVKGTNKVVEPESVRREFFHKITLRPNESQSFTMTISNLKWSPANSSIWPLSPWFRAVPKGRYELYFAVGTGRSEVVKLPESTVERNVMNESNHIVVSLVDGI